MVLTFLHKNFPIMSFSVHSLWTLLNVVVIISQFSMIILVVKILRLSQNAGPQASDEPLDAPTILQIETATLTPSPRPPPSFPQLPSEAVELENLEPKYRPASPVKNLLFIQDVIPHDREYEEPSHVEVLPKTTRNNYTFPASDLVKNSFATRRYTSDVRSGLKPRRSGVIGLGWFKVKKAEK